MTWRIALFSSVVLATVCPASGQSDNYRLRWKNGDEIVGQIVSASAEKLVWNSAVSRQDVTLDLSVLDSISAATDDDSATWTVEEVREQLDPPSTAFRVILAPDMVLIGDLKAITATHVILDSDRLGEVSVDRRWIDRLSVERLPPGIVTEFIDLVGARGSGWRSIDHRWEYRSPRLQLWDVSEPGRVATWSTGARLFLSTELPSSCDIELTVESTRNPRFSLALGGIHDLLDGSGELKLKSESDELAVSSSTSEQRMTFDPVDQLGIGTRRISVRVYWNRQTGEVSVFSDRGRRLAEARMAPAPELTGGGVLLENQGADLTVTRLKVRSPDAEKSPRIVEGQSRLRTMEGQLYFGTLSGPDDEGDIEIRFGNDVARVAVGNVAEIELVSPPPEPTAVEGNCRLTYRDGTTLQGDLIGIENRRASLRTAFSPAPINCPLTGLNLCEFRNPADDSESASGHVLKHAGEEVRGTLSRAETALGWRFVGAEAAIPLDLNEPLIIARIGTAEPGPEFAAANSDVVVLKRGDLLPCRVESIDDGSVVITTVFSERVRIPQDLVQAVSFGAEHMQLFNGFQDEAWQINGKQPDAVERRDNAIVFHDAASVSHPTLMSGGDLEFDVEWNRNGQSYLLLTLMPDPELRQNARVRGINREAALRRGLVIARDRPMFYLIFQENGVMVYVRDGNVARAFDAHELVSTTDPIHVRIRRVDNSVAVFINDRQQGALTVSAEQAGAMGVTFQTQSLRQANRQRGGDLKMTIRNLRAGPGGGLFHHVPILDSAREHVVTVPRMRRDHPPSHVLIGSNGDLLRGKLLSFGTTGAQFESRLNDIVVPRDRLSGIVWLTEPEEGADDEGDPELTVKSSVPEQDPSAGPTGSIRATFGNGVVLTFSPVRVESDELVARHRVYGECRFALASITRLFVGNAEIQTDSTDQQPAFTGWTLINAPEPVIPGADGGFGTWSELVGQPAEDFTLSLLAGGNFRLSEQRGKVVVLDFWATWCGPCIHAMPQLIAATSMFPDDVRLIGVNQEETPEVVRTFLEAREWDLTVAMDRQGDVGRRFRVQGIPQTVIVGRDGTIEHVHLGSSPDLESSLKDVLESLITESPRASGE